MEDGVSAGLVAVQIISSGIAPKEKESSEDSKGKENGEKDTKEEKEKGVSTAETYGIMPGNAHTQKEKEKEYPLTNLPKEMTNQKKKNRQ